MNGIPFGEFNRAFIIDWIPGNIENTSESALAYRHGDGATSVVYLHAPFQPFGRRHRNRAHPVFAKMLLYFERELGRVTVDLVLDFERIIDFGQLRAAAKLHIDHRADDLNNISCIHKSRYLLTERHLRGCDFE